MGLQNVKRNEENVNGRRSGVFLRFTEYGQPTLHDRQDLLVDHLYRTCSIKDAHTLGVGAGNLQISDPDSLVKSDGLGLKTISSLRTALPLSHPVQTFTHRQVQHESKGRHTPATGERVKLGEESKLDPTAISLVGSGRVHEPVGYNNFVCSERRSYDFLGVLGAVR
jgi:hypothetical protein